MCGGGNIDNSASDQLARDARDARLAEEARKARIAAGTKKVDETFAGFNEPFFAKRRRDFMSFYQPQIDEQFGQSKKDLTYALNDAGLLSSTVAGERLSKLNKAYDTQLAGTQAQAEGDVNQARNAVADQKSLVISQLNSTADADRAATEALSRQQILSQQVPNYSPLGDIFGGLASGIGAVNNASNQAQIMAAYNAARSPRRSAMTTVN